MLLQPAIMMRPIMAIDTIMQIPSVRSHRFRTFAIGIKHAALRSDLVTDDIGPKVSFYLPAPMTLVTTLITVSSECSEKSLVI